MKESSFIHLVDDDDAVRESLTALLESKGHKVRSFRNAGDFLSAFEPSNAACVLLDLRLPDKNGLEVQEILNDRGARVPVIMITGFGDVPLAVAAMKSGATDFVEKPYQPNDILARIAKAMEAHRENDSEADGELHERLNSLTPREMEVLEKLVLGRRNKVIARELGISPRTAEVHRSRVMAKMQADSLSHLVRMALVAGLDPKET